MLFLSLCSCFFSQWVPIMLPHKQFRSLLGIFFVDKVLVHSLHYHFFFFFLTIISIMIWFYETAFHHEKKPHQVWLSWDFIPEDLNTLLVSLTCIFRSIVPIHPSFRVLALAEPPATGTNTSSNSRGQQWLNPELLTMFLYHIVTPLSKVEEMDLIQGLVSHKFKYLDLKSWSRQTLEDWQLELHCSERVLYAHTYEYAPPPLYVPPLPPPLSRCGWIHHYPHDFKFLFARTSEQMTHWGYSILFLVVRVNPYFKKSH